MHCLHVLSPGTIFFFGCPPGDKSCGKVHSLLVLSLLRQQLLHLYYLDVCVRARVRLGACVLCCVLLSPHQWVFNWNYVLLWVDHKATVACSSVKQCVKTSIGLELTVRFDCGYGVHKTRPDEWLVRFDEAEGWSVSTAFYQNVLFTAPSDVSLQHSMRITGFWCKITWSHNTVT